MFNIIISLNLVRYGLISFRCLKADSQPTTPLCLFATNVFHVYRCMKKNCRICETNLLIKIAGTLLYFMTRFCNFTIIH